MNPIGRDASNRVSLPFGDPLVSRQKHAVVVYDPRGKKFFVQHGDSSNLTYLGDQPVLAPAELKGRERIRLGDTVLMFVPFCGEDFDWEEE
jgi:pSer/pThr/pTyr-binding forkhead associated (FHA) protein